jgi:8-oxo-dGTP diphosphatase
VTDTTVDVAVGVVLREDGSVLVGQRVAGKPYAGYWEFPGGKLEAGETVAEALARELREELGLEDVESEPWLVRRHVYPHATVRLFFRRIRRWRGEPQSREGQALAWRPVDRLDVAPLLPAALAPVGWLQLPPVLAISCAAEMGVQAFERALERRLDEQASTADGSTMLLQLREPGLPAAEFERLYARVRQLRERYRLRVLVSSRHLESLAAPVGAAPDGIHLTARDLARATTRPPAALVGASCHAPDELVHADALGCDLAVFGPVLPTASHPGAQGLGWDGLAHALREAPIPVYAIGGMSGADLDRARRAGAHGVAMMRAAWRDA